MSFANGRDGCYLDEGLKRPMFALGNIGWDRRIRSRRSRADRVRRRTEFTPEVKGLAFLISAHCSNLPDVCPVVKILRIGNVRLVRSSSSRVSAANGWLASRDIRFG